MVAAIVACTMAEPFPLVGGRDECNPEIERFILGKVLDGEILLAENP